MQEWFLTLPLLPQRMQNLRFCPWIYLDTLKTLAVCTVQCNWPAKREYRKSWRFPESRNHPFHYSEEYRCWERWNRNQSLNKIEIDPLKRSREYLCKNYKCRETHKSATLTMCLLYMYLWQRFPSNRSRPYWQFRGFLGY